MKLAFHMLALALAISLSACNKKPPEPAPAPAPTEATAAAAPAADTPAAASSAAASATLMADLDWNTVPESTVDIGAYPYFKAPETMRIDGNDDNIKLGVSEVIDISQLISYTGDSFYAAEGKVTKITYRMAESGKTFNQYLFDKSIDPYVTSLGAKLIFKGQIPSAKLKELDKANDMTVHNFVIGDPWNSDPFRIYALKQKDKRLMIQVFSNSATGTLGFVELKAFQQTIQKYSADTAK
jgi:OmpA-OmpF porin, OOP family